MDVKDHEPLPAFVSTSVLGLCWDNQVVSKRLAAECTEVLRPPRDPEFSVSYVGRIMGN